MKSKQSLQVLIIRGLITLSIFTLALSFTGCNTTDTGVSKPFPDCFDNIQNQGEQGIDCGGPCLLCEGKITAKVDGVPWQSEGNVTSSTNNNSIIILSGNGTSTLSLIHTGPFVSGSYILQSALYTLSASGTNYISYEGTINFIYWDYINNQISGTFSFSAFESSGAGDTIHVTEGKFLYVNFQP